MSFNSKDNVILGVSDVEIGAVEGKDSASDNRWLISAANTARAVGNMVLAVQAIDASGAVMSTSGLALEAGGNLAAAALSLAIIEDWDGAGNYANYCKSAMYIDNGSGSPIIALGDAAGNLQVDVVSGGGGAVTVADGADVCQGTTTDAKSTATDATSVTVMQVLKEISYMEQSPASRAVTNAGTFATQAVATIADGADVTQGSKTDAKSTATDATSVSVMQVLKQISESSQNPPSRAVTGTFYPVTQPISEAAPGTRAVTNAGTFATQAAATVADGGDVTQGAKTDARNTATDATSVSIMQVLKEISYMEQNPASRAVTGTFYQGTQPVSLASAQVASGAFASGSIAAGAVSAGAYVSGSILAGAMVDGADVTQGLKTDAASVATDATSISVMQVLKQISKMEQAPASRVVTATDLDIRDLSSASDSVGSVCTNAGTFVVQVDGATFWSTDLSGALEASSVSKGSAGVLYKAFGRIDATAASATYYVQLINASSLPEDGAVTMLVAPIKIIHVTGADSYFDLDVTGNDEVSGIYASTGIVICCSSTEFTKTITAAMLSTTVLYV